MPDYSPKYRAKSKLEDWVAPDAEFFASKNYEGESTGTVPDVCTWSTGNLVLSKKAHGVFKELLEKSGEFLPIRVGGEKYYIFNTFADHS